MVEQVTLNLLVSGPVFLFAECIDLQGDAELSRLELTHHLRHVLVDVRIRFDISGDVGTEHAEVGLLTTVDDIRGVNPVGFVIFLDISLFLFKIFLNALNLLETFQHLGRAKLNALAVDGEAPHDASSTAFRHASPVGELIGDHRGGGYGGDCVVKVLYLYGGEVDFQHRAIGLTHHNPVANAQHVVQCQLDAAHKP